MRAPDVTTPARPSGDNPDEILYVRSYLLVRLMIGILGTSLPIALLVGDGLLLSGEMPRASISAYYHSGLRDVLVAGLCIVGFFLMTYQLLHYNWDNVLSVIAGVAACFVAVFPTAGPSPLTPIQELLGEACVSRIHLISAAVFILGLAAMSFLFGLRDGRRTDRACGGAFWRRFHWGCALAIVAAVGHIVLTKWTGRGDEHAMFFGEAVATFAFGLSWLGKGLELDWLLNRPRPGTDVLEAGTDGSAESVLASSVRS